MSRWLLGSSRSITSGAESRSLASNSRRCWPREKVFTSRGKSDSANPSPPSTPSTLWSNSKASWWRSSSLRRSNFAASCLCWVSSVAAASSSATRSNSFWVASSSSKADLASWKRVRPGGNSATCWSIPTRAPGWHWTLPMSGSCSPPRMQMRVVLPEPLGPTNPTRSQAWISNDTSSKSGVASYPRDRLEHESNSMAIRGKPKRGAGTVPAGAGGSLAPLLLPGFLEEPPDERVALRPAVGGPEQLRCLRPVPAGPPLVPDQDLQRRDAALLRQRHAHRRDVNVEAVRGRAVEVAWAEPARRPVGGQL